MPGPEIMRIVTWNCHHGESRASVSELDRLGADISVLQECSAPASTDDQCVYFKKTSRQGVCVSAKGPWRIEAVPCSEHVLDSAYPVAISGPRSFHMLAIWAQKSPGYVRAILNALDHYGDFLRSAPSVIVGDFNSNPIWDHGNRATNHTALSKRLGDEFGLISAFHGHVAPDGRPESPTYFHQWDEARPYHLDYCFIPKSWLPNVRSVEIGTYSEWAGRSDHRPLVVELAFGEIHQVLT